MKILFRFLAAFYLLILVIYFCATAGDIHFESLLCLILRGLLGSTTARKREKAVDRASYNGWVGKPLHAPTPGRGSHREQYQLRHLHTSQAAGHYPCSSGQQVQLDPAETIVFYSLNPEPICVLLDLCFTNTYCQYRETAADRNVAVPWVPQTPQE